MTAAELIVLKRQFEHLLWIANKDRETVPFKLNEHQLSYFANSTNRDIIAKCRQLGFSSGVDGELFLKCATTPNTNAVVISHDALSTEKLFNRVHFFTKHCTIPIDTSRLSKSEITFPETDSHFYVGTAGSREFGRGDTITDLHCSEYAFWPDPERLARGLFQAVPSTGRIIIESTANGFGNSYYHRCMNALKDDSSWALHFYPWYIADEYELPMQEDLHLSYSEAKYRETVMEEVGVFLSDSKMLWRRMKVEELGEDHILGITPEMYFDQEYPYSLNSAFLVSGSGVFSSLNLSLSTLPSDKIAPLPFPLPPSSSLYVVPSPGAEYVLGVDPAEGLRRDLSSIQVIEVSNPSQQCFTWNSDIVEPDKLAHVIKKIGEYYNNALVVVERNNHGLTTLTELKKIYPDYILYKEFRWGTNRLMDPRKEMLGLRTGANKAKMVDDLYAQLRDGFILYDKDTLDELLSFIETKTDSGRVTYGAQQGCKDDRVMALTLAIQGLIVYHRKVLEAPREIIPWNSPMAIRDRLHRNRPKRSTVIDSYFYGDN